MEKPTLTDEDVKDRVVFANKYMGKSREWWLKSVQMHIDVKHFAIFLDGKGRRHIAQVGCRGAYRGLNERFAKGVVKPNTKMKYNSGVRGVKVLAGVGGSGKVLMWHFIESRWNSHVAADMYEGPVLKALKATYPTKRRFNVLEDNDPAGFKSAVGKEAKTRCKIDVFHIPKRSPDLNICDYALWKMVNKRMRAQEKGWLTSKKEKRAEFMARLRRTAMRLPSTFVKKAVGNMKIRCERMHAAKGGHFEEGGL
jgi:hypothetical protein